MNPAKMFGAGLAVVALIVGFVFFAKRGDHLEPKGMILKERTIALNEETSLLLLDFRLVNDSDVIMTLNDISITAELADGPIQGRVLPKSDLIGTFRYFPVLGEKYNEAIAARDEVPPHSQVDRMVSATFGTPLSVLDARKKVTLRVEDASRTAVEMIGK
jgi:hypothetical protein